MGMSDLSMADHLYHYIVGGHKIPLVSREFHHGKSSKKLRTSHLLQIYYCDILTFQTGANKERYKSPSYHIKEGDYVNIDVTSAGATLALGMMFFNTHNE